MIIGRLVLLLTTELGRKQGFYFKFGITYQMSSKKKSAPLPASSGGLMRFFEDETKGFKIDPRIVVSIPIGLIIISWTIELFLAP